MRRILTTAKANRFGRRGLLYKLYGCRACAKKIVHIGGSPYIRGRASRFNSLLFRTFDIIRVAWDSVKPFPVRREPAHIIETMTIHLRENENLIGV